MLLVEHRWLYMKEKSSSKLKFYISLLLGMLILSWLISSFLGVDVFEGNVAVIPLQGFISLSDQFVSGSVTTAETLALLEKAKTSAQIKGIILEVNSGGGRPVASEVLVNAINNVNKTCVALIRDVGASGAYWAASACDKIVASKYSLAGSIGVQSSYIDFAGTLERYNASYERIVGGELKDLGSSYKELENHERTILQRKVDSMHKLFLADIKEARNLTQLQMSEISTGVFFTGIEAQEVGLVDVIGQDKEAKELMEELLNETIQTVKFTPSRSFFQNVPSFFSFLKPKLNQEAGLLMS